MPRRLGQPMAGHNGTVNAVAFSPDERTLASGGDDSTVLLWDLSDRNVPRRRGQPMTGHNGAVNTVAFSPDGSTLVSGNGDVRLWDLTVLITLRHDPLRAACIRGGGALDPATWSLNAPSIPYEPYGMTTTMSANNKRTTTTVSYSAAAPTANP